MRVAACVCTRNRPASLARCLATLRGQTGLDDIDYRIVVVDNSADANARNLIEGIASSDARVHYVHEPRRGIVAARNAALDRASAMRCDALFLTDDDCLVPPDWISEGAKALRHTGAPFVAGDIVAPGAPAKRSSGDRTTRAIASAPTGNLAIDARKLGQISFDERFSRSGGEDRFLTLQLSKAHGRGIHLSDWAVIHDDPPDRSSFDARVLKFRAGVGAHFRALWWSGYKFKAVSFAIAGVRFPVLWVAARTASFLPLPPRIRHKLGLRSSKYRGRSLGWIALLARGEHDYFGG